MQLLITTGLVDTIISLCAKSGILINQVDDVRNLRLSKGSYFSEKLELVGLKLFVDSRVIDTHMLLVLGMDNWNGKIKYKAVLFQPYTDISSPNPSDIKDMGNFIYQHAVMDDSETQFILVVVEMCYVQWCRINKVRYPDLAL